MSTNYQKNDKSRQGENIYPVNYGYIFLRFCLAAVLFFSASHEVGVTFLAHLEFMWPLTCFDQWPLQSDMCRVSFLGQSFDSHFSVCFLSFLSLGTRNILDHMEVAQQWIPGGWWWKAKACLTHNDLYHEWHLHLFVYFWFNFFHHNKI